jgi:predicted DNA-binding protein (UPF0251 family)
LESAEIAITNFPDVSSLEKVEKVVITKEHYEALELLAQYGLDLLEKRASSAL